MTTSSWNRTSPPEKITTNSASKLNDIVIVGAGISGLTTAYLLVKAGKQVTVLYRDSLSQTVTSMSTAQLNTVHDDGWKAMLDMHGADKLKSCYQSYEEAFVLVKAICKEVAAAANFEEVPAYLFAQDGTEIEPWLEDELAAAKQAGVKDISKTYEVPGVVAAPVPALLYAKQAQLHPIRYLKSILDFLENSDLCHIVPDVNVQDVQELDASVELQLEGGQKIVCNTLVLATNVPIHKTTLNIESLAPYRSYVIELSVKKNSVPSAQFWDNGDPYHYVRLIHGSEIDDAERDVLLVGGEDHRVGQKESEKECWDALKEWASIHFPEAKPTGNAWSSQTIETFDGMPIIGSNGKRENAIIVITGDSGTGITHGTVGAIAVSNSLLGIDTPWAALYKPDRTRMHSLKRWMTENAASVSTYADWVKPGDVGSENDLQCGQGAILRSGTSRIAAYRDEGGKITKLCATCPHLGASLRWNDAEKTWDCPAHGSRFDTKGHVLNGPATSGLTSEN